MVFLRRIPPSAGSRKITPPPDLSTGDGDLERSGDGASSAKSTNLRGANSGEEDLRVMLSLLADAGCTLYASGPPLLPADAYDFRRKLGHQLARDNSVLEQFVSGLSFYISREQNLRRVLIPAVNGTSDRSESLARVLLLVEPLQKRVLDLLLEKVPEYFDVSVLNSDFKDCIARMIVNQFRWLDFVVDPESLSEKLMQVVSISPFFLKKEIIGSLPEIIGDCSNCAGVMEALENMLQEDSELVIPILDAFLNLNFTSSQLEQAITIALSCIRTVDTEHLPDLLRFLLMSADKGSVGRIIFQIREQLKFVSVGDCLVSRNKKLKGKYVADGSEASILEALRSCLRFRNVLCDAIFKDLSGLKQPRDYKVIDVWLLVLMHINGGTFQKGVEKLLKRKIVDGCIEKSLFDQCIQGQKNLVKEYFPSFIKLSAYLLTCAEEKARNFGIHLYTSLFGEFNDSYTRQEVLSSLISHIGSGYWLEVSSALNAMGFLASSYSVELVLLSSHVIGILDYLEAFSNDNLRKVYEVFCQLSFCCPTNADSAGASIARELLILVRKQLGNPDMRYRTMGIIGASKIVSILGSMNSSNVNVGEALEFLKVSFDSCKQEASALILLYDELTVLVQGVKLQSEIVEWMGMRLGDFESLFVTDLERGQLLSSDSYVGLEGEPWMNLDGDTSIICLNILPVLIASLEQNGQSTTRTLPAQLLLLSTVERLSNQGSLEGIDALLGCPLHLPSKKYLDSSAWNSSTEKQKRTIIFSLCYAINWMRELLNAFSTQITVGSEGINQGLREETTGKLLRRLRNILFLESLLNCLLKSYPLSLPKFNSSPDMADALHVNHLPSIDQNENVSLNKKSKYKRKLNTSGKSDIDGNLRQPTIINTLKKAGALEGHQLPRETPSSVSCCEKTSQAVDIEQHCLDHLGVIEISAVPTVLYAQESKFRILHVDCLSILSLSKQIEGSCCSDPPSKLSLHLYLLRELHRKLDHLYPLRKPKSSSYVESSFEHHMMLSTEFLGKIRPLFPSLRKHLDSAISLLTRSSDACEDHWRDQHIAAGNFDLPYLTLSNASVGAFVCQEVLYCCGKMMSIKDVFSETGIPILRELLSALQPTSEPHGSIPTAQNIDHLYHGAYSFLEGFLNTACQNSLKLATEVLVTLESLVTSIPKFLKVIEENDKKLSVMLNEAVFPLLQRKLGASAYKILTYDWTVDNHENPWKDKGDILPRTIQIFMRNNESRVEFFVDLACSILPQVSLGKSKSKEEIVSHAFPSISPATFIVWYRTLHEENIAALETLIHEMASSKIRREIPSRNTEEIFEGLQQSVDVVVSLVQMCKVHDQVSVHALAVKYGGKFVDIFIKGFGFLEVHFQLHNDIVIQMVKDLQKATRTIQILCSEAKRGAKRTVVTSRVPAAKRSMERFVFRVKAMLHNTSNGSSFWMGNLKHKDLLGQVVSSQLCVGEDKEDNTGDPETE